MLDGNGVPRVEHQLFHAVDVLLDELDDGEIAVDDVVGDRVQHRERAHGETLGILLE
ncbi:hypothetical protein RERY_29730 [Rhodococcus erythropolis]|nr:hypothetical protein RERY_29730 [Rhodococcus erythropolis]